MVFEIGDKVIIDGIHPIEGYIVSIMIDPITEDEVEFEKKNWVVYIIRVFKNFYSDGYSDFYRDASSIRKVRS